MRFKRVGNQKGFSLVELMVVVAIIGILTSIAVPRFQSFRAKAIRAEANTTLANIATLQELYYTSNDTYGALTAIGFQSGTGGDGKYTYTLSVAPTDTVFTAQASTGTLALCPADGDPDVVTLDQDGTKTVTTDGLNGC